MKRFREIIIRLKTSKNKYFLRPKNPLSTLFSMNFVLK